MATIYGKNDQFSVHFRHDPKIGLFIPNELFVVKYPLGYSEKIDIYFPPFQAGETGDGQSAVRALRPRRFSPPKTSVASQGK
jgi:hypothetical protein